ncbi:hypothetical protein [Nocardia sp. NPDC058633]|uniref:hypothetical protein n=1 Tax=Nocardia sp. NPDC058633 TaxID=3346568 RepID=UPI0036484FEF
MLVDCPAERLLRCEQAAFGMAGRQHQRGRIATGVATALISGAVLWAAGQVDDHADVEVKRTDQGYVIEIHWDSSIQDLRSAEDVIAPGIDDQRNFPSPNER